MTNTQIVEAFAHNLAASATHGDHERALLALTWALCPDVQLDGCERARLTESGRTTFTMAVK